MSLLINEGQESKTSLGANKRGEGIKNDEGGQVR
jgi:hypothetical protein